MQVAGFLLLNLQCVAIAGRKCHFDLMRIDSEVHKHRFCHIRACSWCHPPCQHIKLLLSRTRAALTAVMWKISQLAACNIEYLSQT